MALPTTPSLRLLRTFSSSHHLLKTKTTTKPVPKARTTSPPTTTPTPTPPQPQPLTYLTHLPPYPYGRALTYKQRDSGLYGTSHIQFGNQVSSKNKLKSRRTWRPNIHRKRLWSDALGELVRVKVATRVLRTIDKVGGLDQYLLGEKAGRVKELGVEGWRLRWRVMKRMAMGRVQDVGDRQGVQRIDTGGLGKGEVEGAKASDYDAPSRAERGKGPVVEIRSEEEGATDEAVTMATGSRTLKLNIAKPLVRANRKDDGSKLLEEDQDRRKRAERSRERMGGVFGRVGRMFGSLKGMFGKKGR